MRQNVITEVDGKLYHPEEFAAPYGWKRVSGARVDLTEFGHKGLWCEITNDQKRFLFCLDGVEDVLVMDGFLSDKLNGHVTLPVDLLLFGTDDEIKAGFKERGLPSCTRLNAKRDFEDWYLPK